MQGGSGGGRGGFGSASQNLDKAGTATTIATANSFSGNETFGNDGGGGFASVSNFARGGGGGGAGSKGGGHNIAQGGFSNQVANNSTTAFASVTDHNGASATINCGDGGFGLTVNIDGENTAFAGGGGGGAGTGITSSNRMIARTGGGGSGNSSSDTTENGTVNRGGGGGGNGNNAVGGAGSRGIVIISFPETFADPTISGGLSAVSTTNAGNKIIKFQEGAGTVTWD